MLRTDGKHIIYRIEYEYKPGEFRFEIGMPENASGASREDAIIIKGLFWEKGCTGKPEGICAKEWREFGASGQCWQETGIHGTEDLKDAATLQIELACSNPGKLFRVVQIELSQKTEVISTSKFSEVAK